MAEPFAGGAGASLNLLFSEETPRIYINDLDYPVYCFWWSVLKNFEGFSKKLRAVNVDIEEWKVQREIYRSKSGSELDLGFAAFFLNRCNRSGIIMNGGPIGGIAQAGHWKIGARFNKEELWCRCARVQEYSARVFASDLDAREFLAGKIDEQIMFFIDPPYFNKGKLLYMNKLNEEYHAELSTQLRSLDHKPWVLTYDDCPEIRSLYEGWATVKPFALRYAATTKRSGKELLIMPRGMQLPFRQQSAAIEW